MNDYLIAVILGIVEGLTEFIPVSSTGHLILAGDLLGFSDHKAASFEVFIQLGAILAVLLLYRERFLQMISMFLKSGFKGNAKGFSVLHVALAIGPALLLGFLLHKTIKTYLFSVETVLMGLVAGALLMLAGSRVSKGIWRRPVDNLDDVSLKQAFLVGVFQCLSLWPGFSRSGSTIAGGMLSGLSTKVAAEVSFIIAVPVMFAATGYDLLKSSQHLGMEDIPVFAIGFVVSFVVAWLAIVWFIRMLQRVGLEPFVWYRLAVAAFFWMFILK